MTVQQFDHLDREILSLQATVTMWRTLPDEVESIRQEFKIASQKQKELEQQVQLKQMDVDELSESGIASTMLNVLGKRKELLGHEKAKLQELQEVAQSHQQEVDSLFQELTEAESQLASFREAEEKLAQDKTQQLDLILSLPETAVQTVLKRCLEQEETAQVELGQLQELAAHGRVLQKEFLVFWKQYKQVFVLFRNEDGPLLKITEALNSWVDMFAEAQRPFWHGRVTPFAYLPLATKVASADKPQRTSWGNHLNRLYRFVRDHVEKLEADQIDKQQEVLQLAEERERLIRKLWQRERFANSE